MNNQKKIEEIANEIYETLMLEAECPLSGMDCAIIADLLVSKDYRKASEVARDILDEAYEILKELKDEYRRNEETREACAVRNAMFKLAELKDKMDGERREE